MDQHPRILCIIIALKVSHTQTFAQVVRRTNDTGQARGLLTRPVMMTDGKRQQFAWFSVHNEELTNALVAGYFTNF